MSANEMNCAAYLDARPLPIGREDFRAQFQGEGRKFSRTSRLSTSVACTWAAQRGEDRADFFGSFTRFRISRARGLERGSETKLLIEAVVASGTPKVLKC